MTYITKSRNGFSPDRKRKPHNSAAAIDRLLRHADCWNDRLVYDRNARWLQLARRIISCLRRIYAGHQVSMWTTRTGHAQWTVFLIRRRGGFGKWTAPVEAHHGQILIAGS